MGRSCRHRSVFVSRLNATTRPPVGGTALSAAGPIVPANAVFPWLFEAYVETHLKRRALEKTICRRRLFACPACGEQVPEQSVAVRRARKLDWITCAGCDARVSLRDVAEQPLPAKGPTVGEMNRTADVGRERAVAVSILQGKVETDDFDVFLCHNGKDKPAVKEIALRLKERGILPWLDEWELRPGLPWQSALAEQIKKIRVAAVFVGDHGLGHWQEFEQAGFFQHFVRRRCPVIPVILPNCMGEPEVSVFLENMTWVDFRKSDPDPLDRLIWGISGQRAAVGP